MRLPDWSVFNKRTRKSDLHDTADADRQIATYEVGGDQRELSIFTKKGRRTFERSLGRLSEAGDLSPGREYLLGWSKVGESTVDTQTTIRSDVICLHFLEKDGSLGEQRAIRLRSYPRRRKQQLNREQLLEKSGLGTHAAASQALSGKSYWEACKHGFVDLPGFTFSQSHRAWAQKHIAKVTTKGVPKDAFVSLTLLVAAVPSVRLPPFSDYDKLTALVRNARDRIARSLRRAGVLVAYVNGGFEVAEHKMFQAHHRVREFVAAYRERYWPEDWKKARPEYVYVIHVHLGLWAHSGAGGWLPRNVLKPFFDSEFQLPYESWLALRPNHPSEKNAARVAGYLRKPPHWYSDALILEDVHLRRAVPPEDLWVEGVWCFGAAQPSLKECGLRDRELARRREIECLEITGAAVGFIERPVMWPDDVIIGSCPAWVRPSLWVELKGVLARLVEQFNDWRTRQRTA